LKYFHVPSFHGNYSFLNSAIVANSNSYRNISIFYLINLLFDAEAIQGGNYLRAETIWAETEIKFVSFIDFITFSFLSFDNFYLLLYFQSSCYYLFHDVAIWSIFIFLYFSLFNYLVWKTSISWKSIWIHLKSQIKFWNLKI
jgi:hypothetical protein